MKGEGEGWGRRLRDILLSLSGTRARALGKERREERREKREERKEWSGERWRLKCSTYRDVNQLTFSLGWLVSEEEC